jgi:hypothetical protein
MARLLEEVFGIPYEKLGDFYEFSLAWRAKNGSGIPRWDAVREIADAYKAANEIKG